MTYNAIATRYAIALDQAGDNAAYAHREAIQATLAQYRLHNHKLHVQAGELWINDTPWYKSLPTIETEITDTLRFLAFEIESAPWAARMHGMSFITKEPK